MTVGEVAVHAKHPEAWGPAVLLEPTIQALTLPVTCVAGNVAPSVDVVDGQELNPVLSTTRTPGASVGPKRFHLEIKAHLSELCVEVGCPDGIGHEPPMVFSGILLVPGAHRGVWCRGCPTVAQPLLSVGVVLLGADFSDALPTEGLPACLVAGIRGEVRQNEMGVLASLAQLVGDIAHTPASIQTVYATWSINGWTRRVYGKLAAYENP